MSAPNAQNALLLTGGGARAAYQVGVLRSLARAYPAARFPILTGVSAGAINVASLANSASDLPEAVDRLAKLWEGLTIHDVLRTDPGHLLANVLRWGCRLVLGGSRIAPAPRALFDTAPLDAFLHRALETPDGVLRGIDESIRRGSLSAVGILTTRYPTGQSVTWIGGRNLSGWKGPSVLGVPARLTVDHIMASCALPLMFPAVKLADGWHGDGGVRLVAPLAPAIRLGASRVLAISTLLTPDQAGGSGPQPDYPPPATIIDVLLNSIFLDTLEYDAWKQRRLNRIINGCPVNGTPPRRPVRVLLMRPSCDLCAVAADFESRMPRTMRYLVRGFGTRQTHGSDFVATVLFQPDYIRKLMEIGERDGLRRMGELSAFLGLSQSPKEPRPERPDVITAEIPAAVAEAEGAVPVPA